MMQSVPAGDFRPSLVGSKVGGSLWAIRTAAGQVASPFCPMGVLIVGCVVGGRGLRFWFSAERPASMSTPHKGAMQSSASRYCSITGCSCVAEFPAWVIRQQVRGLGAIT